MSNERKPRYRWPWLVLFLFLLAVLLAVLWMRVAVQRVREYRFGALSYDNTSTLASSISINDTVWTNNRVWIPGKLRSRRAGGEETRSARRLVSVQ